MTSILCIVTAMTVSTASLPPGEHRRTIEVSGRKRGYLVYVPKRESTQTGPFPVVLAFHGGGSNARQMVRFCGLNETADRHGFVVVYPEGTGRRETLLTWNAGDCCGYAMRNRIDDVAFVRALLDDLAAVVSIDDQRIYATGMSNGAMMAYRLACEMSDRIAAIAPVSGPMGVDQCRPKRPVPVMHFHGTDDLFAPFEGGRGKRSISQTNFRSVADSLGVWIRHNGCPHEPQVTELPDRADDGIRVVRKVWGPGRDGAEVVLFEIRGGGHTWPGRRPPLRFLGPSTQDIDANELMWAFFQKHPLRD